MASGGDEVADSEFIDVVGERDGQEGRLVQGGYIPNLEVVHEF